MTASRHCDDINARFEVTASRREPQTIEEGFHIWDAFDIDEPRVHDKARTVSLVVVDGELVRLTFYDGIGAELWSGTVPLNTRCASGVLTASVSESDRTEHSSSLLRGQFEFGLTVDGDLTLHVVASEIGTAFFLVPIAGKYSVWLLYPEYRPSGPASVADQ